MGRLVLNDGSVSFQPVRFVNDVFMREHIPCNFHNGEGRFELVGKIVNEILLYFGEEFLAIEVKQADGKSDQGKGKRHAANDPEIHFPQDIERTMRKEQYNMIVVVAEYG